MHNDDKVQVSSWVEIWEAQTSAAIVRMERHLGRSLTDAEKNGFLPPELLQRLEAIDRAVAEDQPSEVVGELIRQACQYAA